MRDVNLDGLVRALESTHSGAERYASVASIFRDLNPRKTTTQEVDAIFRVLAIYFERAGQAVEKSAESIQRILDSRHHEH